MALAREAVAAARASAYARGALQPGEAVLACVSGGADSTFLAASLAAFGHPLRLLHVAHGLRGADSEADREACERLAQDLGVELVVADGLVADGSNLEGRAREARREAALAAVLDGEAIATGHTRDDRAETILYRLATSRGRAAFRALPPRDGRWARPLLALSAQAVRDALRAAGIGWREDGSNADRRFARNRLRLDVLPALGALHPAAVENLLATADQLADEEEALDEVARTLLVRGAGALDVARAAEAPPALARHALRLLAGPPAPPRAGLDRALGLLSSTDGSSVVPLDGARVAERRYGTLIVRPAALPAPAGPLRAVVPGTTALGPFTVRIEPGASEGLDAALAPDLVLRPARAGDRLAGRRSTVRRLLADARVPRALRDAYPVVVARGEVVSIPGLAVAPAHLREHGLAITVEHGNE